MIKAEMKRVLMLLIITLLVLVIQETICCLEPLDQNTCAPPTLLFSSCLAACLHGGCQMEDPEHRDMKTGAVTLFITFTMLLV